MSLNRNPEISIMFPHPSGGVHIVFGPFGISTGFGMMLSCLHYIVNQWLNSYQIFMDI